MSLLRANLAALAERDRELAERLCWPAGDDHVATCPGGAPSYRIGRSLLPLELSAEAAQRAAAEAPPHAGAPLVFGLGLGEIATALLADPRRPRVVAWERDPWLLRLALARSDWRDELRSGRLRLLLGTDLLEEAHRAPLGPVIPHPLLAQVYAGERALLAAGGSRPVAMVCAGDLFVRDLSDALSCCGLAPFTLDVQHLSREELSRSIAHARPELVASINYVDGLAEFCADHRVKLICWEIDPSTSALASCARSTENAFVFTYRRAAVHDYRAAGFQNVEYLPLAANPGRRRPLELTGEERARYGAPVSIVGASMVLEVLRHERSFLDTWQRFRGERRAREEGAGVLDRILREQAENDSQYRVPEIIERHWPDFARSAAPTPGRAAGEIAAALKRLRCARRLSRFGVKVWGDEGWREVEGDGVSYEGPAGHEREITKVYCGSSVNVDVGRLYQQDIVTMRVFDVMACGGFVLAERSDDLGTLFDLGTEVDCWSTPGELVAKVGYYLEHPTAARELARRGREAVLARHTIQARVEHMLNVAGCRVSGLPVPG